MNRKDIAEIRRRFTLEKNAITLLRGCYVNDRREVVSQFSRPMRALPEEEQEKYLALFRRTLAGVPGRNLLEIEFAPHQVDGDDAHGLLMSLRSTALTVDAGADMLCRKIIDSLELEGNYLILMLHDAYDVPFRSRDGQDAAEVVSEEVFSYIMVCVCPVKQSRPGLSYFSADKAFHNRDMDWVVCAPELGFLFPAFDERAANIYSALYFTRDADEVHGEFIDAVFHANAPMSADVQREAFQAVLEDSLEEDLRMDVVQGVHEKLREIMQAHEQAKDPEPLTVSRNEVGAMLASCGVPEERVEAFRERFDDEFGLGASLNARNIAEPKKFEVTTPDISIRVNPERSDLVETRVIDGVRYILIRAEEGVEVNGLNVNIALGEED